MNTDARAVATQIYRIFDIGDVAALDDVLAPELVDHNPIPGTSSGVEGMRLLVAAVRDAFTATRHEVLHLTEAGEGWIVGHWRMTGIHTGQWLGTPATGRPVSFTGTDLMRVVDGKVVELRHVEELFQLHQQITA
ncbi:ester cyclase [Amycolatopsis sp. DSM 110486]|uniref:ester cyclase n=1 Tax=Amycolatopsis sp. DSM 110486 TaxID=2865832 RepID=UPI001C69AF4C|nr:ester cyclase [Amycolatopsis sp. DSM 110486]QYN18809.1 ester cyclase [Amycolatopsis sp. DSM 110486]